MSYLLLSLKWFSNNKYLKTDNNTIYNHCFSKKTINHIGDLFENNSRIKNWEDLKAKHDLDDNRKVYRIQIFWAIPKVWKEKFLVCSENIDNLIIHKHHLIKKHQIYFLEKLNSIELYNRQSILKKKNLLLKNITKNFF